MAGGFLRSMVLLPRSLLAGRALGMPPRGGRGLSNLPAHTTTGEFPTGRLQELASEEQFTKLIQSDEPVVVDFSAVWCGPCRMLTPILEEAAKEHGSIPFVKIDIDSFPGLASRYNVFSVPMVAVFRSGRLVDSFLGARNAQFVAKFVQKQLE